MADTKISDMVAATSLTSYIFTGIQGGTNKRLSSTVVTDYVDAAIAAIPAPSVASIPVGGLLDFAGAAAPSGWLLCYGQAISRTTYADLFTALSTTYGSGDGSTTFNVPDFRGRVLAGKDDMGGSSANRLTNQSGGVDGDVLGATGGAETHTISSSGFALNHGSATFNLDGNAGGPQASVYGTMSISGSGAPHNNVQPTIVVNKIIYTGV